MDHHAYLVIDTNLSLATLPDNLRQQSVDVLHVIRDSLGIDEARYLKSQAEQSAFGVGKRTFVIAASSMTVQAQNALLKLFEEPPVNTQFYLVLPDERLLIPTLRSRLMLKDSQVAVEQDSSIWLDFRQASYADRLKVIAEKVKDKDQVWINEVVNKALKEATKTTDKKFLMSAVLVAQNYTSPGASKKMLLEELTLSIPAK